MVDRKPRMSAKPPGHGRSPEPPDWFVQDGFEVGPKNDLKLAETQGRIEALRAEGRADDDAEMRELMSFAKRYTTAKERAFDAFVQAAEQG